MNDSIRLLVKKYLKFEQNQENRKHIEQLSENNNKDELERLLGSRLAFGTAGIRGRMGPGFSQMNDLVIIQTSQGLVSYLLESKGEKLCKEQGVVIGHDARHNSERFSRLAALAFLQKSIPVYYCDHIIPTPLVAYGVRHFDCLAGIVVTASHNPKTDNGYKVYWSNGAQILAPHDKNIQSHIEQPENQLPWPKAWLHDCLQQDNPLPREYDDILFRIHGDLSKSYFGYIEQLVGDRKSRNQSSNISITYTTMHGVGHTFLSQALDIAGFVDTFPVESQKKPDPEFSTVKFPNPEEAGALDLAFETAKHANSKLILALDPDADRCAGAIYNPETRYKRILTGNELGALLGWWLWECHKTRNARDSPVEDPNLETGTSGGTGLEFPSPALSPQPTTPTTAHATGLLEPTKPEDCYMLSTAVSSKFLKSMAQKEGFKFIETLTGFKYMGNQADELVKQGKCVLFAYEEAIGYMVDGQILDKDGISAAVQLAQCAAHVSLSYDRTLEEQLDWLHTKYGYHYNLNSYYVCTQQSIIRKIFHMLQTNFPKSFIYDPATTTTTTTEASDPSGSGQNVVEEFVVTRIRDLNSGFDSGTADHKPDLPTSTSSFMITFFIQNDITFTIRTSGTEPKIKYYSEIIVDLPPPSSSSSSNGNDNSAQLKEVKLEAQRRLQRLVAAAISRCLKPELYNLEPAG